jgi:indole-3-glycerol phosphate synthase
MSDVLTEICDAKRKYVAQRKALMSEQFLFQLMRNGELPRGFQKALQEKVQQGYFGLIAEIKKASPSKGVIREDFFPPALARNYRDGGAACLSVLTDMPYFQGHDNYLLLARESVELPVLRKDFILDPYQVLESRAVGADCILLIMAALEPAQAAELEAAALELGMDVLVEVHDERELEQALSHLKSTLIGINNRNLKTLQVDLATSETLAPKVPADVLCVCESGISTHADLQRMKKAGISCFLVGESLMREADVTRATRRLLGSEK